MAALERRVRELTAESPGSNGPVSLRGDTLRRVLDEHVDTPLTPSRIRHRH